MKMLNSGSSCSKNDVYDSRLLYKDVSNSCRERQILQVSLILEGKGSLFLFDKVVPFGKGDLFLFGNTLCDPLKESKMNEEKKIFDGVTAISLYFNQERVENAVKNVPEAYRIVKLMEYVAYGIKISNANRRNLVRSIEKINSTSGLNKFLLFLKFIDDVSKSKGVTVLSSKAALKGLSDKSEPKLHSIFNFIKRKYKETITLEQIAAVAHMSPTGFCRFFKTMTQKTFSQYLTEVRIENACALLSHSNYSIAYCCYSSGYNNLSNFHRHFKKNTGMSPSQYRASVL